MNVPSGEELPSSPCQSRSAYSSDEEPCVPISETTVFASMTYCASSLHGRSKHCNHKQSTKEDLGYTQAVKEKA